MTQDIQKDTRISILEFSLYHYRAIRSFCTVKLRVILEACSITQLQEIVVVLIHDPEYIIYQPKISCSVEARER